MNIFDLTDGYYMVTDAEKQDVENAIKVVKELLPDTYESYHLEKALHSMGFKADIYFSYDIEKVAF